MISAWMPKSCHDGNAASGDLDHLKMNTYLVRLVLASMRRGGHTWVAFCGPLSCSLNWSLWNSQVWRNVKFIRHSPV